MKAHRDEAGRFVLSIDREEALWLKGYMQNSLFEDECDKDRDKRSRYFYAIEWALNQGELNQGELNQGELNTPEPNPVLNESTPIWDLVILDMKARDNEGRKKYGTPLQAHNGRRPLVDAYQETLDLAVYIRQELEERGVIKLL